MERLTGNRGSAGITAAALRTWGLIFLAAGVIGRGLIQNAMLGIHQLSVQELLQMMNDQPGAMGMVTLSLVLQAMESCAVPIFAFLVVEGYQHTKNYKNYLLRVLAVALVSELLYNIVMEGTLFSFASRNPVWGVVLSLIVLYFFRYADEKARGSFLLKLLVVVMAVVWAEMLIISHGSFLVILVSVMWLMRKKQQYRVFVGCGASALCCLISPFYIAATMGFMAVHFYNGEKGEGSRAVQSLAYPAILLACLAASLFF